MYNDTSSTWTRNVREGKKGQQSKKHIASKLPGAGNNPEAVVAYR
jgi:hypothetical protein